LEIRSLKKASLSADTENTFVISSEAWNLSSILLAERVLGKLAPRHDGVKGGGESSAAQFNVRYI